MVGQLRPRRFRLGLVGALVVAAGIGIAVLAPEPPATAQICSRVAAENTTLDKLHNALAAEIDAALQGATRDDARRILSSASCLNIEGVRGGGDEVLYISVKAEAARYWDDLHGVRALAYFSNTWHAESLMSSTKTDYGFGTLEEFLFPELALATADGAALIVSTELSGRDYHGLKTGRLELRRLDDLLRPLWRSEERVLLSARTLSADIALTMEYRPEPRVSLTGRLVANYETLWQRDGDHFVPRTSRFVPSPRRSAELFLSAIQSGDAERALTWASGTAVSRAILPSTNLTPYLPPPTGVSEIEEQERVYWDAIPETMRGAQPTTGRFTWALGESQLSLARELDQWKVTGIERFQPADVGDGGLATSARLNGPAGLAVDGSGNLYVADQENQRIRMVTPDGIISTVVGTGAPGFGGDGGVATQALLHGPRAVAIDRGGNLYVADTGNGRVRKVDPSGGISTAAGGGRLPVRQARRATEASLFPIAVAVDREGSLYVLSGCGEERCDDMIVKVTPAGDLSIVAGGGSESQSNVATQVSLEPLAVAADADGNIYIAELWSSIRKVSPGGEISNVLEIDQTGFASALAIGPGGSLYVTDPRSSRVLRGRSRIEGIDDPTGIAVDSSGTVYVSDGRNGHVWRIPAGGFASVVAGVATR